MMDTVDIEIAARACNALVNQEIEYQSIQFINWIKYRQDLLEKFLLSEITTKELYDLFIEEITI